MHVFRVIVMPVISKEHPRGHFDTCLMLSQTRASYSEGQQGQTVISLDDRICLAAMSVM